MEEFQRIGEKYADCIVKLGGKIRSFSMISNYLGPNSGDVRWGKPT